MMLFMEFGMYWKNIRAFSVSRFKISLLFNYICTKTQIKKSLWKS